MQRIADDCGCLIHVRAKGTVVAAEMTMKMDMSLFQLLASQQRILLRPLGRTIYWVVPLTICETELELLYQRTRQVICIYAKKRCMLTSWKL